MKMKSKCGLPFISAALFSLLAIQSTSAFASVQHQHRDIKIKQPRHLPHRTIFDIRGGALVNDNNNYINAMSSSSTSSSLAAAMLNLPFTFTSSLRQTLITGTPLHALGALYVISSLTVVPLTWYSTAYSFSVGYGLSIATMAMALLASFPISITTATTILETNPSHIATITALIYGLRLAIFIYVREHTVESKRQQFKQLNKTPPLKRTPLALGVSILYPLMISPVLFALRASSGASTSSSGSISHAIQLVSVGVAAFGIILESIADQHKYQVNRQNKQLPNNSTKNETKLFVGPTTWSYKLCRHPNYLGEILHWIGLFGVGSVTFGTSAVAWISGLLGLYGILSIMFGASSRLDTKQNEMYSGQNEYAEWKKRVPSSLIPFVK